jgi:hypothetical protein
MQTTETREIISPKRKSFKGIFYMILFGIILIISVIVWWNYFYVYGEGVKSGELNYLVKKGNIFKTYEGKLIQSGLRSRTPGSVQSYEFEFSVADRNIAEQLMNNSGQYFDLHYKEYKNTIPWRGYTRYIVDKIVRMDSIGR